MFSITRNLAQNEVTNLCSANTQASQRQKVLNATFMFFNACYDHYRKTRLQKTSGGSGVRGVHYADDTDRNAT
jgi:hypothetical protein